MMAWIEKFLDEDTAATAIEYGLIVSLIAVAIILAMRLAGANLTNTFAEVAGNLGTSPADDAWTAAQLKPDGAGP
jgi:pilus assembly protein Flp/PilA